MAKASILSSNKREIISDTIAHVRKFRFCGLSDDPDEQTAVTSSFRHLVIQLQRLAGPILPEEAASRLNALDVEIDNLYSSTFTFGAGRGDIIRLARYQFETMQHTISGRAWL